MSKPDNLTTKNVISYMKSQISRYEIPNEVISDSGLQFVCAEFAQIMKDMITSNTQHRVFTIHKQMDKQKELH